MKKLLLALSGSLLLAAAKAEPIVFQPEKDTDAAFADALAKTDYLTLPPGEYKLTKPIEVARGLTLIFENGAKLTGSGATLFRLTGGTLIIEGRGKPGELVNAAGKGRRGQATAEGRNSVIDLNHAASQPNLPNVIVRNMKLQGFNGIDGYWRHEGRGGFGRLEVVDCAFNCTEKAIAIATIPDLASARIENSTIDDADEPILLNCPSSGGFTVRGNVLRNFGRSGMHLGQAGQIADGCTTHLSNAIVHDNQLLGGGQRATMADSYTQGILIYGNNVSVQGNIVRDVNRGEPVPGASCGHHLRLPDGTFYRGHWIATETDPHRRLAGAAIYLKANHAIVSGNVCSRSGWRSVIEIKTGGAEHYVLVSGNVVDGRSLAIDSSFGFECNSGRSAWVNNLVSDMPNQAFVVRSSFANTFMNNAIYNAKVGFALSGETPGKDEFIAGNRFFNVEHPVLVENGGVAAGEDLHLPPPLAIFAEDLLPRPQESLRGRLVSLSTAEGDALLQCVRLDDGKYAWRELGPGGKIRGDRQWVEVGPNLAVNPAQSPDALSAEELSRCERSHDNALCRGWVATFLSPAEKNMEEPEKYLSYDPEKRRGGKSSLRIQFKEGAGNWRLSQRLKLPAGRYRASLQVLSELPENVSWYAQIPGRRPLAKGIRSDDWQTLSVDFEVSKGAGPVTLGAYGNRFTTGKNAWIGGVSVRELKESKAE